MAETTGNKEQNALLTTSDILTKVTQIASSTLELREILDTISLVIADTLNKDVCYICLLKPESKVVCIQAVKGTAKEAVNVFCIQDEEEIIHKMFTDLKPVMIEDLRREPKIREILNPQTDNLCSLLAVPVVRDNKLIGILIVQTAESYVYTEEEITLLTIISHNIGAAIRNAELYRSVKAQLDELKVIHEIGKAITSILNIDELLPYICREVSKAFNARGCTLRLLEGETLQIKASYGLPDGVLHERPLRLGEGISGNVALTGEPLLIDDTSRMPDNLRVPGIESTSVICVPLSIGEQVIGTLALYDKKDEWGVVAFSPSDLNSLITFASVSSIAIENARLYKAELDKEREVTQTKDYLKTHRRFGGRHYYIGHQWHHHLMEQGS
ncbi:MAG: GAF domain-containing protein [Deferribacteres bacterium]|nr:GAF domain-containing protein [Deferribacteres bacterium]